MLSSVLIILYTLILLTTSEQFNCIGGQICKNDRLTCNNGQSCTLTCNGLADGQACQKTRLDGSQASNISIYCTNEQDCIQMYITCGTGPCHIYCQGTQSCKKQTITCGTGNCIIECLQPESCTGITVDTTLTSYFTCIGTYCPSNLLTTSTTKSPTTMISPTNIPSITPTQQPLIEHSTTNIPNINIQSTEYTPSNPNLTQDDDELNISGTQSVGKLLTWMNFIYLISLFIFISCLMFCVYILCKSHNKSKKVDVNEENKTPGDVEMMEVVKDGHIYTANDTTNDTTYSETNGLGSTLTGTHSTDGLDTNMITLKRVITTPKINAEGEGNEESVMDINIKVNESFKSKHGMFNDSVTVTEGNDSTTNGTYMTETVGRSRIDTLEDILLDIMNKDTENSHVHNGEENSIVIKYNNEQMIGNIRLILYDFDQTITTIHLYRELSGSNIHQLEMSNERLIEIFGGNDRIERLKKHFMYMVSKDIKLGVLSFGFSNVIEKALYRMNMLQYFSFIIGRDSESMKQAFGQKSFYIFNLIKNEDYNKQQILFIDDDPINIESVRKLECCKTMLIRQRIGMNEQHLQEIEHYVQ